MRRLALATSLAALSAAQAAAQAASAAGDGGIAIDQAGHPLTPWLALASVAMIAMLVAAQWLVSRGPRR